MAGVFPWARSLTPDSSRSIALFMPSPESGHFIFVTLIELSRTAQTLGLLLGRATERSRARLQTRFKREQKRILRLPRALNLQEAEEVRGNYKLGAKNAELT